MHILGTKPETVPLSVRLDASTGLPLLSESEPILQYLMAYLALPYSVAEHGCGKKTSLILDRLLKLRIPAYALWRGLILERDMSSAALAEQKADNRRHALIADNPLFAMGDLKHPDLRRTLKESCKNVSIVDNEVQAGPFTLHHTPQVQFVLARSHVYPLVWFWDEEKGCAAQRVIDPTLSQDGLFAVERVRELLRAPEALLFQAPLLGHFRIDETRITRAQQAAIATRLPDQQTLAELSQEGHAQLIRELAGAAPGTLGDPAVWTYANNLPSGDQEHEFEQHRRTGRGDRYAPLLQRLLAARKAHQSDIHQLRADIRAVTEDANVERITAHDARWSEVQLEPLADVAMSLVYFKSLQHLAAQLTREQDPLLDLEQPPALHQLRGLGVRLRRRIDLLANHSEDQDGEIDARALNPCFVRVTLETVRQLSTAGLSVFVDKVGNVHGLSLEEDERRALTEQRIGLKELTSQAVLYGSHIDSVKNAGKFDGRLGVAGGIEIAHTLHDLSRFFQVQIRKRDAPHVLVSAFVGEEMTFTGRGVSMPGSAAVTGRAQVADIHAMQNGDGERYIDCLVALLRKLRSEQVQGSLSIENHFTSDDPDLLLDACFDPEDFFTPHAYERHIEQAPMLDRLHVPTAFVGAIMGIHQEDFFFDGPAAEAAALELTYRLRQLTREPYLADARITVGILQAQGEMTVHDRPTIAFRWSLLGEKNHAGATATSDRRDPVVAAARLARTLRRWLDDRPEVQARGIQALVGNVKIDPGTNRNVIAGAASLTLALLGGELTETEVEALDYDLRGYAIGTLAKRVAIGGEGMLHCSAEPISYATVASRARLSIDLRAADSGVTREFRARIDTICAELRGRFSVAIHSEVQQHLDPFALQESGQVLLMERSYGGSHNPNETELLVDITRGCILQFGVARHLLQNGPLPADFNLFDFTEAHMPRTWLARLPRYISGALHDTCNIAAKARELRGLQ